MKSVIIIILFSLLNTGQTYAGKYETAMSSAITKLNQASDIESFVSVSATFQRIGLAEQNKWLPYYYAGLAYIWASHESQDIKTIDDCLDKAQVMVSTADELSPDNDEILTLQGYIYMMKIVADPPARGPQYSGMAMQHFAKAVSLNPRNPRALSLQGRMQMGTDQFFGSDISNSCGMIRKAMVLFENQKVKSGFDPAWGKEMTEIFVEECQVN